MGPGDRRRLIPIVGRRGALAAGVMALAANGLLVGSEGIGGAGLIVSSLFMGLFTYAGVRVVSRVRASLKPDFPRADAHDSSEAPVAGGWANPTPGQRRIARVRRLFLRR